MTRIGNIWMEGLIFYGLLEKITELFIKRAAFLCAHISAFSNEVPAPVKDPTINKEKGYFRCAATRARRIKDQKDLEAATGLVDTGHISSLPGASLERRTGVSRERWTIV